jgi:hypothetical protein
MAKVGRSETDDPTREEDIDAVAYFAALIHARRVRDFRKAAEALSVLEKIGVHVCFRAPRADHAGAGRGGNAIARQARQAAGAACSDARILLARPPLHK